MVCYQCSIWHLTHTLGSAILPQIVTHNKKENPWSSTVLPYWQLA